MIAEQIEDQAQALRGLVLSTQDPVVKPKTFARTVAITSGKGGVGKTTVSVNLAIQLSRLGRRVVLLDADLGTANVDVVCNLAPTSTLAHVVAGRRALEDAIIQAPGGFELIPGASGLAQMAALSEFERARIIQEVEQLQTDADLILIDTGAGVSPNVLSFAAAADEMLVVTTPEPTAITDAYAVIKTVAREREGIAPAEVRLLVNMVKDAAEGKAVFDRIDAVCRRFLRLSPVFAGHVVSDPRVPAAVRKRRPFVIDSPNSEASRCVAKLAHRMDRHAAEPRGGGLLQRMATWMAG